MRCAGCGTENGADRRFCGGCGATLGWACPGCGFANDGTARFCGGCGRPAAAPPEAAPAPEGELREVTVLFADLVGYTALSHELEAEEVHALLNRFFEAVDGVVERHGGSIDKHIGDCVMALFGAPVAHGNDAERAVRAGVAIHAALAVLDGPRRLAAHVGIASGRVVASDTGSRRRQDYTVTGDSVNLAARLTELAGAGETLVSADVYEAVAPLVEAGPAGELSVKGLPGPVRAWRVLAMGGRQARQARFVGRGAELAALAALLAECKASARGRAVHIRGEAGLGKSRLTEELQLHAAGLGFACHRTLVLDFGSGTTDPVRALVRSLLEAGHGAAADLSRVADRAVAEGLVEPAHAPPLYDMLELPLPLAGRSTYDAMSPATRAAALRALLAALVERSAARRPLLLTIEDAHWADPVTLAYLSDLAAACARSAALLVVTARPEGDALLAAWRAESRPLTVDLAPLPEEAAQQLAGSLLTGRRDVAAACVRRAEGNPLFLEQLLRAAEAGAGDLPGSLRSIVLARMDRLGRRDRQALRAAAVLGQRFTLAQLRHLMDDPAYGAEPLLQHQLIRADGEGFLFGHALIREGAYDSLLRASRQALHRKAAGWFAGRDAVLQAEHLDRAADPRAAEAYLDAARGQGASYRLEQALQLAERGLALAQERADRYALTRLRAELLGDLGAMPASIAAYEAARDLAGDGLELCRAWIGIAAGLRVVDRIAEALAALDAAEAAALSHQSLDDLARIHNLRGNLYFPLSRLAECRAAHEQSLRYAERAGSAELQARALGGLGDALYAEGRMITANHVFRRCVDLARQHGLGRIEVANLPMVPCTTLLLNEHERAAAEAEIAIEAAARAGAHRAEIVARQVAGQILLDMAELQRARLCMETALAVARRLGARRFEAESLMFLGAIEHAAGRRPEARRLAVEALAIYRATGMTYQGPIALGVLAGVAADDAERRGALAEAEALLAAGSLSHNHLLFGMAAVDQALAAGEWDEAERYASSLADYTAAEPLPLIDFAIRRGRALAAAGRGDDRAAELAMLRDEALRTGYRIALPAIERAIAGGAPSPPGA